MVRKIKLTDDFIEQLRALFDRKDNEGFIISEFLATYWDEAGLAITSELAKLNGWSKKQAPGKAHSWFITSSAALIGQAESTMYNHKRIGTNIVLRGLRGGKNENLTPDHWLALLSNIEKDDTGIIPVKLIKERLEWLYKETDKFAGQVPSARDIRKEYRKNGYLAEEAIHWNAIIRNAKQIKKHEDARVMAIVIEIIRLDKEIKGKE